MTGIPQLTFALALSPIHAARAARHGLIEVRRRRQSERPEGAPAAPLSPALYDVICNGTHEMYGEYSDVVELIEGLGRLEWEPVYPDEEGRSA